MERRPFSMAPSGPFSAHASYNRGSGHIGGQRSGVWREVCGCCGVIVAGDGTGHVPGYGHRQYISRGLGLVRILQTSLSLLHGPLIPSLVAVPSPFLSALAPAARIPPGVSAMEETHNPETNLFGRSRDSCWPLTLRLLDPPDFSLEPCSRTKSTSPTHLTTHGPPLSNRVPAVVIATPFSTQSVFVISYDCHLILIS